MVYRRTSNRTSSRKAYGRPQYRRSSYTRPFTRPRARRSSYRAPARSRPRSSTSSKCVCPGEKTPAQKFLLAQADPFDPSVFGAKIPDSSTVPSVAITDIENVPLTLAVATNQKCYAFLPSYGLAAVAATEGAAGWTWQAAFAGGANRAKRTNYVAQYELDRPVAHALRITSAVAPTAATGFVHVAIAFESDFLETTWTWPTSTSGMSGYQFYKRVTLASLTQSPLTIINKFTDETAFRYSASQLSTTTGNNTGDVNTFQILGGRSWGALLVAFEGTGSLSPVNVEHLLMTEATVKFDSVVSGTSAAPSQPSVLAGASNMSANSDFSHTEQQQDSHIAKALREAAVGMAQAGEDIAGAFAPYARDAGYRAAMGGLAYMSRSAPVGLPGINNANRIAS